MGGWIKIHRKIQQWTWWQQASTLQLLLYLLLNANNKEQEVKNIVVKRGQLLSSRRVIARGTGLSEQQVRTGISHLLSTGEITAASTRKYTLITINNYEEYQAPKSNRKEQNDLLKIRKPSIEQIAAYCRQRSNNIDATQFYDYYESTGWHVGVHPMKDWQATVRMWEKRKQTNNPGTSKQYEGNKYERF